MDGNLILNKLKKLKDVNSMKDVKPLTNYLFPGKHCPLMGAALAVRGIKDAMMVVIGTDECAYYTKSMAMTEAFGGVNGRCVSVVIDTNDVTFGSVEKVERAFVEIIDEYEPSCVFLVTTCVIEIIGDDFDALADNLTDEYNIPIMAVHTEHFKSEDHMPGVERTMTACVDMMEKQADNQKDGSVNVLGQRLGDFTETELYDIFQENNIKIGLMLPSGCDMSEIKMASKASVNIVVHGTALPLAKKMKKKFGTPYVLFERMANPERTKARYKELFEFLDIELPTELDAKYKEAVLKVQEGREKLKDIGYIYGNTPYRGFEINEFMCDLGMKPLLLQISELTQEDLDYKKSIEAKHNPPVSVSANISPLQYVYDVTKPHLYLGHEYVMRLRKKQIAMVRSDSANSLLGYETTIFLVDELIRATEEATELRENPNAMPKNMPMMGMGMMGKPKKMPPKGNPIMGMGGGKPNGGGHPVGIPKI